MRTHMAAFLVYVAANSVHAVRLDSMSSDLESMPDSLTQAAVDTDVFAVSETTAETSTSADTQVETQA